MRQAAGPSPAPEIDPNPGLRCPRSKMAHFRQAGRQPPPPRPRPNARRAVFGQFEIGQGVRKSQGYRPGMIPGTGTAPGDQESAIWWLRSRYSRTPAKHSTLLKEGRTPGPARSHAQQLLADGALEACRRGTKSVTRVPGGKVEPQTSQFPRRGRPRPRKVSVGAQPRDAVPANGSPTVSRKVSGGANPRKGRQDGRKLGRLPDRVLQMLDHALMVAPVPGIVKTKRNDLRD